MSGPTSGTNGWSWGRSHGPRLAAMFLARGLAASGTAVIAFFMAAVMPAATWPLIDGDVWWHLRAGEDILATGAVPRTDTWSYTAFGAPWISQDWLTNATMAAVRGVGPLGETALSLLFGLIVATAFAVLWRTIGVRNPAVRWAWRIVWLTLGLVLAAPVLGVRVQMVDLLLSAVTGWLLARYLMDRRRRWVIALPLLSAAWANLHAGWPILFLLGGALVVGEAADRLFRRSVEPEPLSLEQLRDLSLALVVAFGALALNPSGTALWGYPMQAIGNSVINRYIEEWYSVTDDARLLAVYLAFVLLAVIPTLTHLRRHLRLSDALVLIGLSVMPLFAVRFLLLMGPLATVLVAVNLEPGLAATRFGRWSTPKLDSLAVPREARGITLHLALASALVLVGVGASLAKVVPPAQSAAEAAGFPVGAVAWLDAHEPGPRMFNRYEWGGYLVDQRPGHLVFIDGRAQDVYSDELLTEYAAIISASDPGPALDRYRVDYVVFAPTSDLGAWLDGSSSWESVYVDPVAEIWARR